MPSSKNALGATKQVILKLCVEQARLTEKLVVVQKKKTNKRKRKKEASKQSHDELTPNQAIINTKLQKNEKEEVPVQGKHEHEGISSRKKKKMNKSGKRKKQP